jgi:hypothetical protein
MSGGYFDRKSDADELGSEPEFGVVRAVKCFEPTSSGDAGESLTRAIA